MAAVKTSDHRKAQICPFAPNPPPHPRQPPKHLQATWASRTKALPRAPDTAKFGRFPGGFRWNRCRAAAPCPRAEKSDQPAA